MLLSDVKLLPMTNTVIITFTFLFIFMQQTRMPASLAMLDKFMLILTLVSTSIKSDGSVFLIQGKQVHIQ